MRIKNFAVALASLGFGYLADPWPDMPDADELPSGSFTLIAGAQRIAVPTADYKNIERVIARYEQEGVPLEIESQKTINTSQFTFNLYVLRGRHPDPEAIAAARVIPLATMRVASARSSLQLSAFGLEFHSEPDPWSNIGQMPLLARCIEGGGWVAADIRVTRGTIVLSVLDRKSGDQLAITEVATNESVQTIFLRLVSFAAAGNFVMQNWRQGFASEGILQAVRIAAVGGPIAAACEQRAPQPAASRP